MVSRIRRREICEFITFQFAAYVRHFIMTQLYSPPATWYLCVKLSKRKKHTYTPFIIYCILFIKEGWRNLQTVFNAIDEKNTHNNKKMIPMRKKNVHMFVSLSAFFCDKRRNWTKATDTSNKKRKRKRRKSNDSRNCWLLCNTSFLALLSLIILHMARQKNW